MLPQQNTTDPEHSSESISMTYERLLSIQSLSEVENPWKGITLNRCMVLAVTIVLVSSVVNEVHDALSGFVEETDSSQMLHGGSGQQSDSTKLQASFWESLFGWGSDDGGKVKPKRRGGILRIRNREVSRAGLLKER
ncbi:hypothetical protein DPEC_G00267770 [Dallia pectoralis]|uniref:Uncharacterized protein n=1 Tax=Dallia pectoralis TaxID=75939 RepID=A0ACC2FNX9_DALPE|nr:hypothetical protein DPEC_G00267770 [Dallia pectoralis]